MSVTVQSSYSERMLDNSPGTMQGSDYATETGICETAGPGGIPFGVGVSQGAESDQGVIIGGSLAGFRGVSVKDVTVAAEQAVFLPDNSLSILVRGSIWTEPKNAVAANGAVYMDAATGKFDDAASGNIGPIPGARWVTSCEANGRALVYFSGYAKSNA